MIKFKHMHKKLVVLKNAVAPVINHIPLAKRIIAPFYQIAKRLYINFTGHHTDTQDLSNGTDDMSVPQYYINSSLVHREAEHLARMRNRKTLYFEREADGSYQRAKDDPRLIAVYLPQFHKVPLNEKTWGKGFTEWTNVAAASPGLVGQQQPMLPADLGFYDLDRPAKIKEQIDLAKKYGIYGFMFYYYWFSGEKILDVPINTILKNKSWDFNFMICWANENWTKRWDGMDSEVIIGQKYNDNDPIRFIEDVAPILNDKRYITIDGERPILAVYRPSTISNIDEYARIWRQYFKDKYGKEIYLIVGNNHTDSDPREYGFDALYDFSPGSVIWGGAASEVANIPEEDYDSIKLDPNFYGSVVDYRNIALDERLDAVDRYDFPTFQALMPHWDNHARKKGRHTHALINSTPEVYASWLDRVLEKATKKEQAPLVFLNAWNEWAEGAILEPTLHLGHANLLRTAEILSKYSSNEENAQTFPLLSTPNSGSTKIAVIIHLFYPEMWEILTDRLKYVVQDFDIFVTIPERHKDIKLEYIDHKVTIVVVPNWGRDILPFLHVLRKVRAAEYEYVLKLHSKKSKQISRINATYWLRTSLNSLLFNKASVNNILKKLSGPIKMIGIKDFAVSMSLDGELSLKKRINKYYSPRSAKMITKNINDFTFSAGSMFWARVDAFDDILDRHIVADDFELESGQLWDTLAHFLERDFWINIYNRYGNKSLAYVSSDGKLNNLDAMQKLNNDIDLPNVLKTIDKSSIGTIDNSFKVSIIITNYNYGKYIEESIKSSLNQTYNNTEIIIVDDGSTDGISQKIISKYIRKYPLKIFGYLLGHQGVVPTRNFSLDKATGDFIVFLDADDLLPKDYVERMLEEAVYGQLDVVYADMHNFGKDIQINSMPEFNRAQMLDHNLVNMSALIRRTAIGNQKFDDYLNTRKVEDWDFFIGLMLSGAKFSKTHTTYLKYRIHTGQRNNNIQRDKNFWDEHLKTVSYIRDKYRRLYPNENIPN